MVETLVIGGGIAGFAVALAVWERGGAVSVLEARRPGGEATGAAAGMLAAQYESNEPGPRFRFAVRAREAYPRFVSRIEELSGQALGARWDGLLMANRGRVEHEVAERAASWQREVGLEAELIDPGAAEKLQPGVAVDVESYLWLPAEGQVDTQRLAAVLGDAIGRTDVRLIVGNRVTEVVTRGGAVEGVRMDDGRTLIGDRVVVAAGAWSGQIAGLPRALPVRPMRGEMLRFATAGRRLRRIVGGHGGRYVVPRADGTALAGSTMEDVGFDRSITDEGLESIHAAAARLVPALRELKPIERWAGLRPISADGMPILGPDSALPGLHYATGYGRDGILIAPLAGAVVADLAVTGSTDLDWRPFSPERFAAAES